MDARVTIGAVGGIEFIAGENPLQSRVILNRIVDREGKIAG
jgi:hypothetical protein